MMNVWAYLTLAAVANTFLQFFWKLKLTKKTVDLTALALILVGSFCTAWGIDVIQRGLEIMTFVHVFKVSLGCWLMVAVATAAKHYRINNWSMKQFKLDYGGDLIGFLLMGVIIHVLS